VLILNVQTGKSQEAFQNMKLKELKLLRAHLEEI
jgi:hypothetical protein